jgi:hypothetical protein
MNQEPPFIAIMSSLIWWIIIIALMVGLARQFTGA